jgi:hypothetical protein
MRHGVSNGNDNARPNILGLWNVPERFLLSPIVKKQLIAKKRSTSLRHYACRYDSERGIKTLNGKGGFKPPNHLYDFQVLSLSGN